MLLVDECLPKNTHNLVSQIGPQFILDAVKEIQGLMQNIVCVDV